VCPMNSGSGDHLANNTTSSNSTAALNTSTNNQSLTVSLTNNFLLILTSNKIEDIIVVCVFCGMFFFCIFAFLC
jgi:hypothetical protein